MYYYSHYYCCDKVLVQNNLLAVTLGMQRINFVTSNASLERQCVLLLCIPLYYTFSSAEAYWECVKHIAAACNIPFSGEILDQGKALFKDLVCSG
jgi:hypothetical protein